MHADEVRDWFDDLEQAVQSLRLFPARGATAPQGADLRQLMYGTTPHIYRIVYAIDQSQHIVAVLHIRHSARLPAPRQRRVDE